MKRLVNTAKTSGRFDNQMREITSNSINVDLPSGLSISKSACQSVWRDGNMEYTLIITNTDSVSYSSLVVTDIINPSLASLTPGSITINNIPADLSIYSYENGVLKITLDSIAPNSNIIIRFKVRKELNDFFRLENVASLDYEDVTINSNQVVVMSIKRRSSCSSCCNKPYLG